MELIKKMEMGECALKGKAWFPLQNEYISLRVDDFEEVNNEHIDLIQSLQWEQSLKDHIESAFYEACESFKHAVGLEKPVLTSTSDIWKYVNFYGIKIDKTSTGKDTFIVLEASGKWEDEHSYELVIKNGCELVYLGSFLYYPADSYGDISGNDGNYALR